MRAEILTIGDELCRGEIVDTNSSYLAARLWDLDITTRWMTSCGDSADDMTAALATAVGRADLVVCSGGLGPTEDDLTVDVVARLAGVEPVIDDGSRARMEAWFAGRVAVTPIQLRQVRVPAGARVHGNPVGLAPCFELALRGVPVICLPGIPREIYGIWDGALGARLRELREAGGDVERVARRIYRVFGRGESQIAQACAGLIDQTAPPSGGAAGRGQAPTVGGASGATIHYQVKFPETLVKLVVRDRDRAVADARLAGLDASARERLAGLVYGTGEQTLPEVVAQRLIAAGKTIAVAESCTGGMLGEMLTRTPGMSAVFMGGAIVYSNREKVRQLGVDGRTLATHGAVSEETVREMATGARERFGTDLAVAITGIAGPDGGTPDKPVGTVWIAVATEDGLTVKRINWPRARDEVRTLACWWALKIVSDALQDAT